ncbi:MAG: hypothetical protein KAJ03_04370 [Gammaproteobacteria bacterium]|nr:hypothetical protein [Gammaproteobacteria bacterium]
MTPAIAEYTRISFDTAATWGYSFESSFDWLDEPDNDIKQFGYIEMPQNKYIAPRISQRMQKPFRGNKFRLGGQKT